MTDAVLNLNAARLRRGNQTIWRDLTLHIKRGEFIAVLGANGAGKTTLLKVLLGLIPLTSGSAQVLGEPPRRGNQQIGYVPQRKNFDSLLPICGRDLVRLGADGHRYGLGRSAALDDRVSAIIEQVGASSYADAPIGLLSGGEQQRLRIAQALIGQPQVLFCDEPLLSLDVASQASVVGLIDRYRRQAKATVLFVTHEINPILGLADRILYLANGRSVIDTPQNILTSKTLSRLFGAPIEVLNVKGRIIIVGADSALPHHDEENR